MKILPSLQLRKAEVLEHDVVEGLAFPLGAFDEVVEVVDVGLMMFAVMVVEGLDGDLAGEGVFGVR